MIQKIFFRTFILLFSLNASSQSLNDPVYFNYSLLPETDFDSKNGNVSTNFLELNATFPAIKINNQIRIFNAVYYRNSTFEYSNLFPQHHFFPGTLHDIRYSAVIRIELNKNWELIALPRIMLRSDLKQSVTGNDIFPQVAVLATYAIKGNPNFKIGFGGALNNDFERNAFVPLVSLYYDSKKVKVEIIYPNANFLYKQSEDFEFGLFTSVDGAISKVSPFQLGNERVNYLRTFQLLVAPTVSHRIYKNIFAHLKIGIAPVRNYEAMDSDFNAIQNQNFDLQSSLFFRTGISYRLKN